ncbi:TIGR02444 family protein [Shewanella sp. 125m-7]
MTLSDGANPDFYLSLWTDCDTLYLQHQNQCLALQDDHQLNVNLLLLAIWLDNKQHKLASSDWKVLQHSMFAWEERLLLPYRKLRRQAKAYLEQNEYQQLLSVELMLERKSQAMILKALESIQIQEDNTTTGGNLSRYLALFSLDNNDYPSLQSN